MWLEEQEQTPGSPAYGGECPSAAQQGKEQQQRPSSVQRLKLTREPFDGERECQWCMNGGCAACRPEARASRVKRVVGPTGITTSARQASTRPSVAILLSDVTNPSEEK